MPRKDQSPQRRAELIGKVAAAFAELGYRRTTTAELARRCDVQEPILYRLWPDKRAMFIAALQFVASNSRSIWEGVLQQRRRRETSAEQLLAYEAEHLGEFGLYRILFAGWSETDDPEIREALRAVYRTFVEFVAERVREHRAERPMRDLPGIELTAWALLGLGTAVNLGRELGLLSEDLRKKLMGSVGRHLLG
ncbi:MAG: TetR/AcrR family transcriptional regulator [Planctomycetes bacterium]|nr:TetR/AcrR family transcriptional regulator [Planctomycetota bacterium]